MKKYIAVLVLLVGGTGSAFAACTGGYLNGNAVNTLLTGKIARSPANCANPDCRWQELHQAGGALIEQHSNTVADPVETVGTWSVATTGPNNGKITHTYTGGGGTYTYDVKDNGANYSFCGSNGEFTFSVQ